MNTPPELSDADRALIERYRRASEAYGIAPDAAVRAAILAEGRRAAAAHAAQPTVRRRWSIAALGGIAAALVGALLVLPQWRGLPPPVVAQSPPQAPPVAMAAPRAAAPPATAPALRERGENALAKSSARSATADSIAAATPEVRDALGRTPLMLATMRGNAELVRQLLAQGADPNVTDRAGRTPLKVAVARGDQGIAALLQQAGAN